MSFNDYLKYSGIDSMDYTSAVRKFEVVERM